MSCLSVCNGAASFPDRSMGRTCPFSVFSLLVAREADGCAFKVSRFLLRNGQRCRHICDGSMRSCQPACVVIAHSSIAHTSLTHADVERSCICVAVCSSASAQWPSRRRSKKSFITVVSVEAPTTRCLKGADEFRRLLKVTKDDGKLLPRTGRGKSGRGQSAKGWSYRSKKRKAYSDRSPASPTKRPRKDRKVCVDKNVITPEMQKAYQELLSFGLLHVPSRCEECMASGRKTCTCAALTIDVWNLFTLTSSDVAVTGRAAHARMHYTLALGRARGAAPCRWFSCGGA